MNFEKYSGLGNPKIGLPWTQKNKVGQLTLKVGYPRVFSKSQRRRTGLKLLSLILTKLVKSSNKDDYSISESLKNLETLRSHLQVLGETSQSFSMIESLEKIFLQQAIQERNKQQKITDLIPVTKLTLR